MAETLFKTLPKILHMMRYGTIPKHKHDDELLCFYAERIQEALKPLLSIDLSAVSPLPWKSKAENRAIADTGDYMGLCYVVDKDGKDILDGDGDGPEKREVEIDGWYHDGNCVAAAACVNAIAELQREFKKTENGP